MRVRWNRLIAIALVIFAVSVFAELRSAMRLALQAVAGLATGGPPQEQVVGLTALGVLLAALLSAVRLLLNHRGDPP